MDSPALEFVDQKPKFPPEEEEEDDNDDPKGSDGDGTSSDEVENKGSLCPQIWATMVIDLSTVGTGLSGGFSAVCLPKIRDDAGINASREEGSWIASLTSLGGIVGCLLCAVMSDRLGRKKTLIVGGVPQLLGYAMIAAAPNVQTIFAGRFLYGLGAGIQSAIRMVYISEVTEPRIRGLAASSSTLCWTLGMLGAYIIGILCPWRVVAVTTAALPLLFLLFMSFLPETPAYMASRGREADAKAALTRLRGKHYDSEPEVRALLRRSHSTEKRKITPKKTAQDIIRTKAYKPFLIMTVLFTVHQFAGLTSILTYAVDIFQSMNSNVDKYVATITVGTVQFVLNMMCGFLVHKVSKRYLLVMSGVGMSLAMCTLGTYSYFDAKDIAAGGDGLEYRWVPVAAVWLHLVFAIPGFQAVPWVLIGELFPLRVRGVMSNAASLSNYVLYFATVKAFPSMIETFQTYGVYWFYSAVAFGGAIFSYYCLPETKGKTLDEIEEKMTGRKLSMIPHRISQSVASVA